jgi:eukaryotic-like serine/threonine-protein kinase
MRPEGLPTRIGRYEIRRELGRGMMGLVYEAYDPRTERPVALKVVRLVFAVTDADRASFERRFLAEARIASHLSHPGIVAVHDMGRDAATGLLYLAFELLHGRTLAEMTADGGRLPWTTALEIGASVAHALHYAHGRGVVHRDIKPANIMVLPMGDTKIMDFGLATIGAGMGLTAAGQSVGTPLFMSPEQVQGQKLDGRSDLFSLGSVVYTLLTGTRAFAAENVAQIMHKVADDDPPPASTVVRDVPEECDYLIARAMAKKPALRYPDGHTMAEDFEDVSKGLSPRHRQGRTIPSPKAEPPPPPSPAPPPEPTRDAPPKREPVAEMPARALPRAVRDRPGLWVFFLGLLVVGAVGYLLFVRG